MQIKQIILKGESPTLIIAFKISFQLNITSYMIIVISTMK